MRRSAISAPARAGRGQRISARPGPLAVGERHVARLGQRIGAVMKWAVAMGYRPDNPAGDALGQALGRQRVVVQHMRVDQKSLIHNFVADPRVKPHQHAVAHLRSLGGDAGGASHYIPPYLGISRYISDPFFFVRGHSSAERREMSSVLRSVRKRKKGRTVGAVAVIDREEYAELEVDAKVELIRSVGAAGLDAHRGVDRRGSDSAGWRALRPQSPVSRRAPRSRTRAAARSRHQSKRSKRGKLFPHSWIA